MLLPRLQYAALRCTTLSSTRPLSSSSSPPPGSLTSYEQLKRSFWPADRPRIKARIIAVGGLIIASKAANTLVPLVFKDIVNRFSVPVDVEHIPQLIILGGSTVAAWVLLYGALRAMAPLLNEVKNSVFATVAQENIRAVSRRTYSHLLDLDLAFHQARKTGQLSRVIDRGTRGADSILRALVVNVVPTVLELGFVFGVLWWSCGVEYSLICAATAAAYVTFTYGITNWRTKFRRQMNKADNQIGFKAVDTLLNYETVKYFNNEPFEVANYEKLLRQYEEGALRTQTSLSLLNSGQQVIITAGLTASNALAASQILAGNLSVGDLVMVNLMILQVSQPLNFLGSIYREIQQSHTDMRALNNLLVQQASLQDRPGAREADEPCATGDVVFDGVTFGYVPDAPPVIKNVSFRVGAGKSLAIVGGSGCGKSTIVRLLYRFYAPSAGEVRVGGVPVEELKLASYRSNVAVVPQDCVLFNETVRYNIEYGCVGAGQGEVERAARLADVHGAISAFPKGYDTVVGERGQMLSGGEKQRIALARAVLKDAPILVYDEATSSLDSLTEQNILESLHTVSAGKTSIFIAHRLSTIMHADEILVLEKGEVRERGTHQELLATPDSLYADMWHQQTTT